MTLLERIRYRLRMLRLALTMQPIAGADDGGDDGGDGGGGGDGGDGKGADAGGDGGGDDAGDGGDDDVKAQLAAANARAAKAERARKKAEKDLKDRQDKDAADQGKFKDLAEQREKEAQEAKDELERYKRRELVSKIARRLNFRDPDDAYALLPTDTDTEDDQAVESALKNLAEEKDYLLGEKGAGGRPVDTRGRAKGSEPDMNERLRSAAGRT